MKKLSPVHRRMAKRLHSQAWGLSRVFCLLGIGLNATAGLGSAADRATGHQSLPVVSANSPVMKATFIFESAPFPSCHASTVVETREGLVAAWFGGKEEGASDVGIWMARYEGGAWTTPVEVANGSEPDRGRRFPCWNPVLFQLEAGPLMLFFKVGPSPREWWGMFMRSEDGGRAWTVPQRLPDGILGPIRSKPVLLEDGSMLCGSSTEDQGWRVHLERTTDLGQTWQRTEALNQPKEFGAIQPTIIVWDEGKVQILNRTRQGVITECWMGATWTNWTPMRATELPNPNAGVDAVRLKDRRALLVYNHTRRGRTPLNVAVSRDGRDWSNVLALEDGPGEYSYPAVIQARDGTVHVTYTWKRRRIRHVILDPAKL